MTKAQQAILIRIAEGWTLKSHRDEEGNKVYRLHALTGEVLDLAWRPVQRLQAGGYIYGNQKFPAATFLLTEKGRAAIAEAVEGEIKPLGESGFLKRD
jgi:hypothetical protein